MRRSRHVGILLLIIAVIFVSLQYFRSESSSARNVPPSQSERIFGNETYRVLNVVDGDTLDIEVGEVAVRVRLIGIDTPEIVDPREPVECFGKESSARAAQLLSGKEVRIKTDPSQGRHDKYGRLLAYVYLPDGTMVNLQMLKEGYAREYTYQVFYEFHAEFKEAERLARFDTRGLWTPGVCTQ